MYLLFGGLGLVHRSCIGLITNQVLHKTWILQHIHIHTCKYIYIYIYCKSKRLRNSKKIKEKAIKDVRDPQKINDISLYWVLIHWALLSTGICHKVQINSKVTNLDSSLWASKTYKVWIPLNPSVFSSAYFRIPHSVFLLLFLFEF